MTNAVPTNLCPACLQHSTPSPCDFLGLEERLIPESLCHGVWWQLMLGVLAGKRRCL